MKTENDPIRLDIGCGQTVEEGWTGVDPASEDPEIIKTDAWTLPFKDGTVSEIRCSHALEHFPPTKLNATMIEWFRVLKPRGLLTISVPDARYVLQYLIDNSNNPWAYTMVFGRGFYPGDKHLTAWDRDRLSLLLTAAGFNVIACRPVWDEYHAQDSIVAEAMKP